MYVEFVVLCSEASLQYSWVLHLRGREGRGTGADRQTPLSPKCRAMNHGPCSFRILAIHGCSEPTKVTTRSADFGVPRLIEDVAAEAPEGGLDIRNVKNPDSLRPPY